MKLYDTNGNFIFCKDIPNLLEENCKYEIFVGTDSKIKRSDKKVLYATAVVLYKCGKGGRILTIKEKRSVPKSLKERLSYEVWKSLEVALELSKYIKNIEIVVHIDVNKSRKHKSGLYCEELASMVVGNGFKCVLKPDAFCAQTIADRFSKREGKVL